MRVNHDRISHQALDSINSTAFSMYSFQASFARIVSNSETNGFNLCEIDKTIYTLALS